MNKTLKTEIIVGVQYFFILLITCFIATIFREQNNLTEYNGISIDNGGQPNISSMITSVWNDYFYWYLVTFLALSTIRFLLIFLFQRKIR